MRWKRILPLAIAVVAAVTVMVVAIITLTRNHKPTGVDAVVSVDVTGNKARIRTVGAAPAATIPDAIALGNATQIDSLFNSKAGMTVHFKLDPSKLPGGQPDCTQPTTNTNMAIAVFDQNVQAWIPLETTCASHELRAQAPRAGMFRAWLVPDGAHDFRWTYKGEPQTARVATTVNTPVRTYLAMLTNSVGSTVLGKLAQVGNAAPVCVPSTKYTVSVQANVMHNKGTVAACTANLHGTEQLKVYNNSGIPLAIGPQSATQYVRAPSIDPNTDIYTLLGQVAGYARSTAIVPAHAWMLFSVTQQTPSTVTMQAQVDITSALLDLATAILSVWAPQFQATSELPQLLGQVSQRLAVIVEMDGVGTIKPTEVQAAIRSIVHDDKTWETYQANALNAVNLAMCLHTADTSAANLIRTAFGCLANSFVPGDAELKDLLVLLSSEPMQVTPGVDAQLKALADTADVKVTLHKTFIPTDVYRPFIGDWRGANTTLHLYADRTGRMDVKLGPCTPGSSSTCWQHLAVNVTVVPDGITITLGGSDVTDNAGGSGAHYPNSYATGYHNRGDRYMLTQVSDELVQMAGLTARSRQNLPSSKLCGNQAAPDDRQACTI